MKMARREHPKSSAICRCRVLYLGSSVPQMTKDGLQGIQEPLRELYPSEGAIRARGIDSWLSVWSNGMLLENVDENQQKVTRFFPIESLHYCAAVRYVLVNGDESNPVPRFLPLDSPFARNPNISHPPLFASIMRRTTGIKVLECHVFICKRETPANALVRCCFHAYADTMYAKSLEAGSNTTQGYEGVRDTEEMAIEVDYSGELSSVNSEVYPIDSPPLSQETTDSPKKPKEDELSVFNGDENHKVWAGSSKSEVYGEFPSGTTRSESSPYRTSVAASKPSRPRQMIMPSVVPPPPPSEPSNTEHTPNSRMNRSSHDPRDRPHHKIPSDPRGNHRPMNPMRMPPPHGHPFQHPQGEYSSKSKSKMPKFFNSLAERKKPPKHQPMPMIFPPTAQYYGMSPPPTHPMHGPFQHPHGPYAPVHMYPPPVNGPMNGSHTLPYPPSKSHIRTMEEPIYMPSSRPLSPIASYQPGHFPHEQYLMQQYATITKPRSKPKKKKKGKHNEELYGRRSHINEKAFSHSIREEQRSRSYGSLVGVGQEKVPENKKEKEIMQMVADLDLSADDVDTMPRARHEYKPPSIRGRSSRR